MQFVVEVAILECSFVKHSQGILGLHGGEWKKFEANS
jgi:hypothetical protein